MEIGPYQVLRYEYDGTCFPALLDTLLGLKKYPRIYPRSQVSSAYRRSSDNAREAPGFPLLKT